MKKIMLSVGLLLGGAGLALAAGMYTNGMLTVPSTTTGQVYGQVVGNERLPLDTQLSSGANPQTVAATAAQVGATAVCMAGNTGTASAGAVTINAQCGTVTSESLATAAGSTYTLTVTNSMVTASSLVYASAFLKSSTAGKVQVQSVTPASGSVVIVVKNISATTAVSGTILVPFFIALP